MLTSTVAHRIREEKKQAKLKKEQDRLDAIAKEKEEKARIAREAEEAAAAAEKCVHAHPTECPAHDASVCSWLSVCAAYMHVCTAAHVWLSVCDLC